MNQKDIHSEISRVIVAHGKATQSEFCHNITGGIINKAALFKLDRKDVFVKYSTRDNAFQMFSSERESLKLIKETGTIRVPQPGDVFRLPECGGACFLLEYLSDLSPVTTQWAELGSQLARMHKYNPDRITAASTDSMVHTGSQPVFQFGFHQPINIGYSYVVAPAWEDDWLTYYSRFSLKPHLEEIERKTNDAEFREVWSELQLLFHKPFHELKIQPSIIHGDFCTINIGEWQGQPVLYDPGCYYGHSEVDFIIPAIEENFPPEFFDAYFKIYPKDEKGFKERQALYVFSANCIIYMSPGNEGYRQTAIDSGHYLLKLLRKYKIEV